jgi:hypothetical protein
MFRALPSQLAIDDAVCEQFALAKNQRFKRDPQLSTHLFFQVFPI